MSERTQDEAFMTKATAPAVVLVIFVLSALLGSGCRHARQNRDVVERDLRNKENQVRELQDELHKQTWLNHAMEQQLSEQMQKPSTSSNKVVPADPGTAGNRVQEIALGRSTGGYDNDKYPGDEALQVSLEPKDTDGHVIKASGTLQVTALEILPGGIKKVLSCWQVSPEELRRTWKAGLLSTGYQVILPWKAPPSTEKMRVVAQFVTTDGRIFEADKDVKIRLPMEIKPTVPQPQMIGPPVPTGPAPDPVQPAAWRPVQKPVLKVELGAPVATD